MRHPEIPSIHDFKPVFFDDRIGEHFLRDPLQLFLSFLAVQAIEIQNEEFSLSHVFYGRIPQAR